VDVLSFVSVKVFLVLGMFVSLLNNAKMIDDWIFD